MAMATTATDLARSSLELVKAGQREQWVDLFDEDAVIEDPVGPSPLDPEGKGHRGRAAIAAFYDNGIAGIQSFDYEITRTCRCGDEVAVMVTFHITGPDGQAMDFDAFNIYQQAPNGKLAALRSFHHGAED
jgi:ketosteroid isomerase-like protein